MLGVILHDRGDVDLFLGLFHIILLLSFSDLLFTVEINCSSAPPHISRSLEDLAEIVLKLDLLLSVQPPHLLEQALREDLVFFLLLIFTVLLSAFEESNFRLYQGHGPLVSSRLEQAPPSHLVLRLLLRQDRVRICLPFS